MDYIIVRGVITSMSFAGSGVIRATIEFLSNGMYRDQMHADLAKLLEASAVNDKVYRVVASITWQEIVESCKDLERIGHPIAYWKIRVSAINREHLHVRMER